MAKNIETLVEAKVIADETLLTDAERQVLEGLDSEEVGLLVRMRRKLDEAHASTGGADAMQDGEFQPAPNVIV